MTHVKEYLARVHLWLQYISVSIALLNVYGTY